MRVFHKVGKQKFNFKFLLNWFFNKLSEFFPKVILKKSWNINSWILVWKLQIYVMLIAHFALIDTKKEKKSFRF